MVEQAWGDAQNLPGERVNELWSNYLKWFGE